MRLTLGTLAKLWLAGQVVGKGLDIILTLVLLAVATGGFWVVLKEICRICHL